MPEVLDLPLPELALGSLKHQVIGADGGEDGPDVLQVLGPSCAVDQNVVKENEYKAMKKWGKHRVHQRLERRRSIGEAEWHHQELKVALVCAERRLVDVVGMHPHLVVARAQIQLGEESGAAKFIEELIDDGNGELVLSRCHVERTVIDTEPPGRVVFAHQQDRRRKR